MVEQFVAAASKASGRNAFAEVHFFNGTRMRVKRVADPNGYKKLCEAFRASKEWIAQQSS